MKYEDILDEFYSTLEYNPISSNAILLFKTLVYINCKAKWVEYFKVANTTLKSKTGLSQSNIQRARNELLQKKYVDYKKGINQSDVARYKLLVQYEQPNEQANEQPDEQADEQANEHIITILNLYFNYIYNNTRENFEEYEELKHLGKHEKKAILLLMKRLEMYVENQEVLSYYNPDQLLDLKLQYWAIKELYFSPFKVYLGKMNRDEFMLRFLKAKKYIKTSDTMHFLNYFIKSLQEEFLQKRKGEQMGIREKLNIWENRDKPQIYEKYKPQEKSNVVHEKRELDYRYYKCDHCGAEIRIEDKWENSKGGVLNLQPSLTGYPGTIKVVCHNKCLQPLTREIEEYRFIQQNMNHIPRID